MYIKDIAGQGLVSIEFHHQGGDLLRLDEAADGDIAQDFFQDSLELV
jgi:hypothetical protein